LIDVAIMLEGQLGLNWPRLQRIAHAVEQLGFAGLYRSDHYTEQRPPDFDSLEAWVSLTWLASHTSRIEFGPLVTPVSFRHPTMLARMASAVDDLSNGRFVFGVGAGWQVREHTNYGLELLSKTERLNRFEEGVQVISLLLRSDTPVEFNGRFYHMHDAVVLPHPKRGKNLPILIGGNGPERTLPLAARYADEWNGTFLTPDRAKQLNQRLDELLAAQNRAKSALRRSMMTRLVFGRDDAELSRKLAANGEKRDELSSNGVVAGTPNALVEQLGKLAESGLYRVMLQWLDLDDLDGLEAFAKSVLPQVK
jgi:F420-dependent oxidoreductase-like protein